MKERPILFSGSMIRAILEGRKTQTRRVVKPQPMSEQEFCERGYCRLRCQRCGCSIHLDSKDDIPVCEECAGDLPEELQADHFHESQFQKTCPYGQPGDRLWVRETSGVTKGNGIRTIYRADCTEDDSGERTGFWVKPPGEEARFVHGKQHWRPSIHMPRSASRITLEVTGVRVERLQEISEADAQAEGMELVQRNYGSSWRSRTDGGFHGTARLAFEELWESITPPAQQWVNNPWVWVIEFKRVGQ